MASEKDRVRMPTATETAIPEVGRLENLKAMVHFQEVTEVATAESGAMGCSMGKELKLPLMELSDMMANG